MKMRCEMGKQDPRGERTVTARSKKKSADFDLTGRGGGGAVDWDSLDLDDVMFMMVDYARRGGIAMIYTSSDDGAVCVALKHDDLKDQKLWFHDQGELDGYVARYQEYAKRGSLPAYRAGGDVDDV
jgi:hypothetical protein